MIDIVRGLAGNRFRMGIGSENPYQLTRTIVRGFQRGDEGRLEGLRRARKWAVVGAGVSAIGCGACIIWSLAIEQMALKRALSRAHIHRAYSRDLERISTLATYNCYCPRFNGALLQRLAAPEAAEHQHYNSLSRMQAYLGPEDKYIRSSSCPSNSRHRYRHNAYIEPIHLKAWRES